MALNRTCLGRRYRSGAGFEVERGDIRRFASAIGETDPVCHDVRAAREAGYRDVVAPPTFLTVLGVRQREISPLLDPDLGVDYTRVVHGEQSFRLMRPIVAGDELWLTHTIVDIGVAGSNELLKTVSDILAADGDLVASLRSVYVSRGTADE